MDDQKNITTNPIQPSPPQSPIVSLGSSGAKEMEGGVLSINKSELPMFDLGKEMELPKEVRAAGVKKQSVTAPIPPIVTSMGVQQVGPTVPLGSGSTISLPLSQQQISDGLKLNILTSWRWLSEWCLRRLKQFRLIHTYS